MKYTVFDEYGESDIGNVTVSVMNVLESVNKYSHNDFSVSNRTRTFLTIDVDPIIEQGDPKTDLGINGRLAYLKNGIGLNNVPIDIKIQRNQLQEDRFTVNDLLYDIIKGRDISNPQPLNGEKPETNGEGIYELEPMDVGHGNYNVNAHPIDNAYADLNVSASFLVERPPLAPSDIVAYLIAILTLIGIGVGALKILPQRVNTRKQKEFVLLYMDRIKNAADEIELDDIRDNIKDLLLKNKISKEYFDLLNQEIDISTKKLSS